MNAAFYDSKNIFAKIIAGEIPCHKIYEDERTFAFLDIMPRADGHVLVLPKAPIRNVLDCAEDDLAAVMQTVQRVAQAAMRAFSADGISILQNNEAAGGQEVFHMHVHVIPRMDGVNLRPPGQKADPAVLEKHAGMLRAAL